MTALEGAPPSRFSVKNAYEGAPWTAEFSGALLGGSSSAYLEEVSGLLDAPEVRTADAALLQRDGVSVGQDYMGGRTVQLTLMVAAENGPEDLAEVLRAFAPGADKPFRFAFPGVAGGDGQIMARVRKRSAKVDAVTVAGGTRVDVELFAADPRLYSGGPAHTREITVRVPRTGVPVFPLLFPFELGQGAVSRASNDMTNSGSVPVYPVIRMVPRGGVVVDPRLTLIHEGKRREFSTAGLRVGQGDVLVIDMAARRLTLNGASRFGKVLPGSDWFALEPGTSQVLLDVNEGPEGLTASVEWRSAWM
ncbi:phage distal tail protein [Kitasatospora sp. NPDC003701]